MLSLLFFKIMFFLKLLMIPFAGGSPPAPEPNALNDEGV